MLSFTITLPSQSVPPAQTPSPNVLRKASAPALSQWPPRRSTPGANQILSAFVDLHIRSIRLQNLRFHIHELDIEDMPNLFIIEASSTSTGKISTRLSKFLGIQSALPM